MLIILQLQAPTYGLAEQAANIIRSTYNGVALVSASSVAPPSATTTQPIPTGTGSGSNGAISSMLHQSALLPLAVLAAISSLLL